MQNEDFEEELARIDKEVQEIDERMKKREEIGLANVLKHFDRIHDKLFTFNNILIAGYFTLSKIEPTVPVKTILIPILNLCFLIFIEYRQMEKSRFESSIRSKNMTEINKYGKGINKTNQYSLTSILTTAIVTLAFLYYLLLK